jgi:hypothetical protein
MRQHDRVRPVVHCDIGIQKSAHVVSCAGESPVVQDNIGGHIVGLKPDSLLKYGSRQGPLQ